MKLLPVLVLLVLSASLAAQEAVPVVPLKPDPPIAVDGNLDEWASIPGGTPGQHRRSRHLQRLIVEGHQ
jgi:hypothetical protein